MVRYTNMFCVIPLVFLVQAFSLQISSTEHSVSPAQFLRKRFSFAERLSAVPWVAEMCTVSECFLRNNCIITWASTCHGKLTSLVQGPSIYDFLLLDWGVFCVVRVLLKNSQSGNAYAQSQQWSEQTLADDKQDNYHNHCWENFPEQFACNTCTICARILRYVKIQDHVTVLIMIISWETLFKHYQHYPPACNIKWVVVAWVLFVMKERNAK